MTAEYKPTQALEPFIANWPWFATLIAILIVLKILGSARFKGWFGECAVSRGLSQLDPANYHIFHDLYLPRPDGQGSTQIDHIIVSPFGVFVIETKNYRGWIFGSEKQREWTQQICRRKSRFQNPLHQNNLHVRALVARLSLPRDAFLPVVFFIGDAQFKTAMPANVLNNGLIAWILRHQDVRLDPPNIAKACAILDETHRTTDRKTAARAHITAIQQRPSGEKTKRSPSVKPPLIPNSERGYRE